MDLVIGATMVAGAVCAMWALRKFRREQAHYRSTADQHTRELTTKIAKYLDEMTRQSERATQLVEAVDLSCARLDKLDVALREHIKDSALSLGDGIDELMGVAMQLQDAVEQSTADTNDDACPTTGGQHHRFDENGSPTGECLLCGHATDDAGTQQQAG